MMRSFSRLGLFKFVDGCMSVGPSLDILRGICSVCAGSETTPQAGARGAE